jgi:uncharacterized membrane-anchored protein
MTRAVEQYASKVPEVTLVFWIIKIAATTLGETGGDSVTMTLNWGYLAGTAIFFAILVLLVIIQIKAEKFHPFIYWATIVASTNSVLARIYALVRGYCPYSRKSVPKQFANSRRPTRHAMFEPKSVYGP